jgi:pyruvate-formate lyase
LEFEEPKQTTGQHLNVNVINQETLLSKHWNELRSQKFLQQG